MAATNTQIPPVQPTASPGVAAKGSAPTQADFPETPNDPVPDWATDLAAIGGPSADGTELDDSPAPKPAPSSRTGGPEPEADDSAPEPKPKPDATLKPAVDPKNQAKAKPGDRPMPQDQGRKAKIDPEALLSVEGVESVELPPDLVKAITSLDARDLRMQSAKLAKSHRALAQKLKEREAAAAAPPKEDPERKALAEQLDTVKKRYEAAETELRYVNYAKSDDYKAKFETPFSETLSEAYEFVQELTVTGDEGVRQATAKDFDELLRLGPQAAADRAEQMFGRLGNRVLDFQGKLQSIQRNAKRAVDNFKKEGAKVESARAVQVKAEREAMDHAWKNATDLIPKRFPEYFAPVEGDDEGNAKLARGYEEVDGAHDPNVSQAIRVGRQAAVRHRAAALPREVYRRKKAEARVAELEAKVKEFEDSVPGLGAKDGLKPTAADDETDAGAAIDRMAT